MARQKPHRRLNLSRLPTKTGALQGKVKEMPASTDIVVMSPGHDEEPSWSQHVMQRQRPLDLCSASKETGFNENYAEMTSELQDSMQKAHHECMQDKSCDQIKERYQHKK